MRLPSGLRPLETVDTRALLPELHLELMGLLEGLAPGDWDRPTVVPGWAVRDVVAHLLDTDLRRVSAQRDRHLPPPPTAAIESEADLVAFLNALNADWVRAARRLSPRVLTDLLRVTGPWSAHLLASLDPEGEALFPVTWAGEASSRTWFDVGREYTERWHHQQQIRLAVAAPLLLEPRWLRPLLALSVRALPHRFRAAPLAGDERIELRIEGASGGVFTLVREEAGLALYAGAAPGPAARIILHEDAAWRVFFKAWLPGHPPAVRLEGRPELGRVFLSAWAVMA